MTHAFQSSFLRGTYLHIKVPLIPTSFVAINNTSMHCHTYWKLTTVVPMVSTLMLTIQTTTACLEYEGIRILKASGIFVTIPMQIPASNFCI